MPTSLLKELAALSSSSAGGPFTPPAWNIGKLANHGIILSCDGFQLRLSDNQLDAFYDLVEAGEDGEIKDSQGDSVLVEPTDDSVVLTRSNDPVYPSGVVLDLKTLKELGIEPDDDSDAPSEGDVTIQSEGVKAAYRRAGKKIKKGFRVTSGFRKGRVVANIKTAYKPRAKASTRMKLKIAGKKKKFIKLLKSRRTRKKSVSKRLKRMNAMKK